jgi:hypothetical protein
MSSIGTGRATFQDLCPVEQYRATVSGTLVGSFSNKPIAVQVAAGSDIDAEDEDEDAEVGAPVIGKLTTCSLCCHVLTFYNSQGRLSKLTYATRLVPGCR